MCFVLVVECLSGRAPGDLGEGKARRAFFRKKGAIGYANSPSAFFLYSEENSVQVVGGILEIFPRHLFCKHLT